MQKRICFFFGTGNVRRDGWKQTGQRSMIRCPVQFTDAVLKQRKDGSAAASADKPVFLSLYGETIPAHPDEQDADEAFRSPDSVQESKQSEKRTCMKDRYKA